MKKLTQKLIFVLIILGLVVVGWTAGKWLWGETDPLSPEERYRVVEMESGDYLIQIYKDDAIYEDRGHWDFEWNERYKSLEYACERMKELINMERLKQKQEEEINKSVTVKKVVKCTGG